MKDTVYFRHDYDSQTDPKMIKLRVKYKREWYWLFRATLEAMRGESDIMLSQCDIDAFAYRLQYDSIEYKEFLDFCVSIWLLCFDEKDKVYFSERLQEDAEYMRSRSKKAKQSANARWKARSNANALQPQSDGNAIKESKRKEKKGKESKKEILPDGNTSGAEILSVYVPEDITIQINELIKEIKQTAQTLWIAYDKTKEREFAKHLLTAIEYGKFCENIWMDRQVVAIQIMRASVIKNYRRWPTAWPKSIYQNYAEVYNLAKTDKNNTVDLTPYLTNGQHNQSL